MIYSKTKEEVRLYSKSGQVYRVLALLISFVDLAPLYGFVVSWDLCVDLSGPLHFLGFKYPVLKYYLYLVLSPSNREFCFVVFLGIWVFQVFKDPYTLILGRQGELNCSLQALHFLPRMFQAISHMFQGKCAVVNIIINTVWYMQWVLPLQKCHTEMSCPLGRVVQSPNKSISLLIVSGILITEIGS